MVLQFIQNVILTGPQANIIYNGKMNRAEGYFAQFDLARREISSQSDYLLDIVSIIGDCFIHITNLILNEKLAVFDGINHR